MAGIRVGWAGSKRKLLIPAHLGYAESQAGEHIKPHSNLIIKIELLEVLTRND